MHTCTLTFSVLNMHGYQWLSHPSWLFSQGLMLLVSSYSHMVGIFRGGFISLIHGTIEIHEISTLSPTD